MCFYRGVIGMKDSTYEECDMLLHVYIKCTRLRKRDRNQDVSNSSTGTLLEAFPPRPFKPFPTICKQQPFLGFCAFCWEWDSGSFH